VAWRWWLEARYRQRQSDGSCELGCSAMASEPRDKEREGERPREQRSTFSIRSMDAKQRACPRPVGHGIPLPIQNLTRAGKSTPKLQLKLYFLPFISLRPISYLINQLHYAIELHEYNNFD
jgi:hypothetical protein